MAMKKVALIALGLLVIGVAVIIGGRLLTAEDTWICQNGIWVKHGNPSSPMPIGGCVVNIPGNQTGSSSLPNPASQNCITKGGKLEIIKETAGELGICKFNDGTKCEEWQFYRGECQKGQATVADTSHPYSGTITKKQNNYFFNSNGVEYTLNLPANASVDLKNRLQTEANGKSLVTIVAAETPLLSKVLILKGFQEK